MSLTKVTSSMLTGSTLTYQIPSDFATLQAAINALLPTVSNDVITLNIESGHVIASQLFLVNVNASQFRITSTDAEVTISRAALTQAFDTIYYPAFAVSGAGAVLPVIDTLFNMDTSGTATQRNGIFVTNGASAFIEPGAGVKNAGGRGLHVANGGNVVARSSNFSGAGEAAVRCSAATCEVRQSNLSGSGKGLMIASTALVDANDADISDCTVGIEVYNGQVRAESADISGCGVGVQAFDGAVVSLTSANINNATGNGVEARRCAFVNLRNAEIKNAGGNAIFASSGVVVSAFNVDADNATSNAIYAISSNVSAATATLTNAGGYGVLAQEGSFVSVDGSDTTGAATAGFYIDNASFLNATGATGTRGRTQNVLTRHGVIFSDGVTPWGFGATTLTPDADNTHDIGSNALMIRRLYAREVLLSDEGDRRIFSAGGSPEGLITAPVGSLYLRKDGGAGTTFYVKESGTGNTGWVAK